MKTFARRKVRGAAAVEMAVTMVLLIPLILYTLFLEDLLAYKLEAQEPTIVAGWDHNVPDYQESNADQLTHLNRLKYCDHTSAMDTYSNPDHDCNEDGVHHEAGTAHQCWLAKGKAGDAEQVTCETSSAIGGLGQVLPMGTEYTLWFGQFNKGGMATCSARLGVMNYFLPNKFFEWAAHNEVTNKSKLGGDEAKKNSANSTVHSEANKSEGNWILKKEYFAVMSDPWALNVIDDTSPNSYQRNHPFWKRANVYFDDIAGGMVKQGNSDAKDYRDSLDELIGSNAAQDMNSFPAPTCLPNCGDDPSSLPLAWKADKTRDFNDGYASGWKDQRMSASNRPNEFPKAWGP